MENFLWWFIKDQTYFGIPRGAKMSLAPNEFIYNADLQKKSTSLQGYPWLLARTLQNAVTNVQGSNFFANP